MVAGAGDMIDMEAGAVNELLAAFLERLRPSPAATPDGPGGAAMEPVTTAAPVTVAAVQATPVLLDRDATIGKVVALTEQAAAQGARLGCSPRRSCPSTRTGCGAPGRGTATLLPGTSFCSITLSWSACRLAVRAGRYRRAAGDLAGRVGVSERDEAGFMLYNSLLNFAPDGQAGRPAPQAHAHGRRTAGLGNRRRIQPHRHSTPGSAGGAGSICWGRTTCRWPGPRSTPRGSTSTWRASRQQFDPVGHYSRSDVLRLAVGRDAADGRFVPPRQRRRPGTATRRPGATARWPGAPASRAWRPHAGSGAVCLTPAGWE